MLAMVRIVTLRARIRDWSIPRTTSQTIFSCSAKKAQRPPQTLGQAHRGAPTENAPGQGGVNAAPRLLAGFGRAVARREVLAGNVLQQLVELVDAGLDAGSDVVRAGGRIFLQGAPVRASPVPAMDVGAGLRPRA